MLAHRVETAGGAINNTFGPVTSATTVEAMMVHVSAAPTTSEYFTVTIDSAAGNLHDVVVYKLDLSAASTTDVFWAEPFRLYPGDKLKTTYANTDKRAIGVTYQMK